VAGQTIGDRSPSRRTGAGTRGPVLGSDGPTFGSKQPWEVEQLGGVKNGRTRNCMDGIIKSVHFIVLLKRENGTKRTKAQGSRSRGRLWYTPSSSDPDGAETDR